MLVCKSIDIIINNFNDNNSNYNNVVYDFLSFSCYVYMYIVFYCIIKFIMCIFKSYLCHNIIPEVKAKKVKENVVYVYLYLCVCT